MKMKEALATIFIALFVFAFGILTVLLNPSLFNLESRTEPRPEVRLLRPATTISEEEKTSEEEKIFSMPPSYFLKYYHNTLQKKSSRVEI